MTTFASPFSRRVAICPDHQQKNPYTRRKPSKCTIGVPHGAPPGMVPRPWRCYCQCQQHRTGGDPRFQWLHLVAGQRAEADVQSMCPCQEACQSDFSGIDCPEDMNGPGEENVGLRWRLCASSCGGRLKWCRALPCHDHALACDATAPLAIFAGLRDGDTAELLHRATVSKDVGWRGRCCARVSDRPPSANPEVWGHVRGCTVASQEIRLDLIASFIGR